MAIPDRQRLLRGLMVLADPEDVADLRQAYFDQEMLQHPAPLDSEDLLRGVPPTAAHLFSDEVNRIIELTFENAHSEFKSLHGMIEHHPHMQDEVRALRLILQGWELLSNSRILKYARTV